MREKPPLKNINRTVRLPSVRNKITNIIRYQATAGDVYLPMIEPLQFV